MPKHPGNRQLCDKRGRPEARARLLADYPNPKVSTFCASLWTNFTPLLTGRVEIDSNSVENLIRPITIKRNNAGFAGHDEGGKAWGRIASLIETCKINGVKPFAYLKATPEAIAAGYPQNHIDDLLPWNFTLTN